MRREQLTRLTALAALAIAAVAVLVVLISSGSTYVLHARFYDAGQLVSGDLVTVAGHQVGSVGSVALADNGLADVELDISDPGITPLRRGTLATIGQLSLTGVANRFVGLTPGPGAPITSGGTLPVTQTRGIVDLDVILNSLTPAVRGQLQRILKSGAYLVSPPAAKQFNQAAPYFNPALSQTTALASEVVADRFALARLLTSTAQIAGALGARSGDLGGAVTNTAAALREVAGAARRAAGRDRPGAGRATPGHDACSADTNQALKVLNPTLRDLRPNAPAAGHPAAPRAPGGPQRRAHHRRRPRPSFPGAERALKRLPGRRARGHAGACAR